MPDFATLSILFAEWLRSILWVALLVVSYLLLRAVAQKENR